MIKSLQSLRFFAILMVFLSHLLYLQENSIYSKFFNRFLYDGYCGVSFFLVLSGFVISYNYYNKISSYSKKEVIEFTKKRFRKIYPLHLLTFLLSILVFIKIIYKFPLKMIIIGIFNITLTQSFIPINGVYFSFNAVSWYLSVILFCYLLTPFLISNIKKIEIKNINLIIAIIAIYLLQVIYVLIFKENNHNHWLIYINPFFRLLDYINGLLLGVMVLKNRSINTDISIKNTIYEVGTILIFLVIYYFYPYINQSIRWGCYYTPSSILIIFIFSKQGGYISKMLQNKYLVYLGNISFEFYMVHQIVLKIVLLIIDNNNAIMIVVSSFIISIVVSIVINTILTTKIFNCRNKR